VGEHHRKRQVTGMNALSKKHTEIFICLIIVIATVAVYWQVRLHAFVSFDDGLYVFQNSHVRTGISMENIAWAFGFTGIAYWHPLTWLSHMLDCQLFGLNPGPHHMINLIFHVINGLLLFFVFKKMTGECWKSGVVAILFALHPLNVESVAWVAERKNVLSSFFWLLTLLSYNFYAARVKISRYLPVLLFFALGLLSKPAIVTLPFVLLLLDFWPLQRLRIETQIHPTRSLTWIDIKTWLVKSKILPLILEKIPFFLLSGCSVYLSFLSSLDHDIVISAHEVPTGLRLANGLVSYMVYFGKLIWPQNLAVFYPYPEEIPIWMTALALIWVLCVSFIVLRWAMRLPYLAVGWLWFLGTMLPHVGLMQAGLWPALADRWAYIPFVGLFMMMAWGIPQLLAGRRTTGFVLPPVTVIFIFLLTVTTWTQIGYWKNNFTLYQRAIDVTVDNTIAHNNLGAAYYDAGKVDRAIYHFVEALKIQPGYAPTHNNLNRALASGTNAGGAVKSMHKLLKIYPENPALHYNLGNLYRAEGQLDQAIFQYRTALAHYPDFIHAMNNLAGIYIVKLDYSEAIALLKQIAALQPNDPEIYIDIARVYALQKQAAETIIWLEKAIRNGFSDWDLLQTDRQLKLLTGSTDYRNFLATLQ
jgi:tetratricopeptide (TPR) repeat protein